jgi:uncharacterized protein (TIGR02001 family)
VNIRSRALSRFVCLLVCVACLASARAQVAGDVALVSDYRFRGVSLSDGKPALQGQIDWTDRSGLFAGAFASTVRLGSNGDNPGISFQPFAGYAAPVTSTWSWSVGLTGYLFPSVASGGSPNYAEVFARAGSEDLKFGVYLSNNYAGTGAPSAYLSVSASHSLTPNVSLLAHVGWLVTGTADSYYSAYGNTRQFDGRLGVAFDLHQVVAEVSVVGATSDSAVCRRSANLCSPEIVLGVRKNF